MLDSWHIADSRSHACGQLLHTLIEWDRAIKDTLSHADYLSRLDELTFLASFLSVDQYQHNIA